MPTLLYETTAGVTAPIGFGAQPGFGWGWGSDSAIHTWYTWPAGPLEVGASMFAFGGFSAGFGSSMNVGGIPITAIDSINQDQNNWDVGPLWHTSGSGFNETVDASLITGDMQIDSATTNPIATIWGGNALQTGVGIFVAGATFDNGVYDPSTGNNAVTGFGFQPDLVVFYGCNSNGADSEGTRMMVGMMDANGNQWVESLMGIFASGPFIVGGVIGTNTRTSEFRTDSCILGLEDDYGAPGGATMGRNRASFVSMDPDGFTVHSDENNAPQGGTLCMAYKVTNPAKAFFQVGTSVQGDANVTGLPMAPGGAITCGDFWSPTINGSPPSDRAVISLGGFDGTLNRSSVSGCGSGTSVPGGYYDDSAIIFGDPQSSTILGRATAAITSDGWDYTWTDDDGGDRPFGWLAFNVPNKSGPPMFNNRARLLGSTDGGTVTPANVPMLDARVRLTDAPNTTGTAGNVPMLNHRVRLSE